MKIVHNVLLFAVLNNVLVGAANCQLNSANPPFTLELTANVESGHSDVWDFANLDKVVLAGDEVVLAVRKTNRSSIQMDKQYRNGERYGFPITVLDSNRIPLREKEPKIQSGPVLGGGQMHVIGSKDMVMQPGESYIERAFPDAWYDLSQPGRYTIQVSEPVNDKPGASIVESNTVTVTVVPANTALFELNIPEHININAGADFDFNIYKKNVSHRDVNCSRAWDPVSDLDLNYQYTVLDSSSIPVPQRVIDQSASSGQHPVLEAGTCKVGQSAISSNNDLAKLYDLTRPGNYTVQVSQPLSNNPADGAVKSNSLSITVYPKGVALPSK